MSEEAATKDKLERAMGKRMPEAVWEDLVTDRLVEMHLKGNLEIDDPEASWKTLKKEAQKRIRLVEKGVTEFLKQSRSVGESKPEDAAREWRYVTSKASPTDQKKVEEEFEDDLLVGFKTTAMLKAMSELFVGLAHQHPEVVQFRDNMLGGLLLSSNEAHNLLASYAARFFSLSWFLEWGILVVGHTAEIVGTYDPSSRRDEIDHRVTVRIDPPGITKRVRYAHPYTPISEERRIPTRCTLQSKAIIPPNQNGALAGKLPTVVRDGHKYPPFLWPGSVVEVLYDLSEKLADQFDWPGKNAAAWFVLTGEAPEVHPVDARLIPKGGGEYLNPQWRIQLTIPPWMPAEEVLQAYRRMQKRILEGRNRLPQPKAFEVARFVWEQERLNEYDRPKWRVLLERWNEEHPDDRFEDYRHFREYYTRGAKVVTGLNFNWPQPNNKTPLDETFNALKKALRDHPQLRQMSAWEVLRKMPAEEAARHLVSGGYLEKEPSSQLVENALRGIDVEEQAISAEGTLRRRT